MNSTSFKSLPDPSNNCRNQADSGNIHMTTQKARSQPIPIKNSISPEYDCSFADDTKYYEMCTWRMYHRIMRARNIKASSRNYSITEHQSYSTEVGKCTPKTSHAKLDPSISIDSAKAPHEHEYIADDNDTKNEDVMQHEDRVFLLEL